MPCTTITVDEPDESSLSVSSPTTTRQSEGVYTVSAEVSNNVTSGGGRTLSATAKLTVDGTTESTTPVSPPIGGSESVQFTLSGLSPGSYNVCIEV